MALLGPAVRAERLPLRFYGSAEGLAGDLVQAVIEDPEGFLWVGTATGLSRFDGARFTRYGTLDGLPHPSVNALLITRDGTLWAGTSRGLARWRRAPLPREAQFEALRLGTPTEDGVRALAEGPGGRVWVGTNAGLLAVDRRGQEWQITRPDLGPVREPEAVDALLAGPEGRLWLGTGRGLVERRSDGSVSRHAVLPDAQGFDVVRGLGLDEAGRLWLAHDRGVLAVRLPLPRGAAPLAQLAGPGWRLPEGSGEVSFQPSLLAGAVRSRMVAISCGPRRGVWALSESALLYLGEGGWRRAGTANGLADGELTALFEDSAGNLWTGTETHGIQRLAASGFLTFGPTDGLRAQRVVSLLVDRDGDLVVVARDDEGQHLYVARGRGFEEVTPPALAKAPKLSWGWNQLVLQDRSGRWWVPTAAGLMRFPSGPARELGRAVPELVIGEERGLPGANLFRLFEDSRGDLWASLLETQHTLARLRQGGERFETLPVPVPPTAPSSFEEDEAGNVWVGFYNGGLGRHSPGGEVRYFPPGEDGLPAGFVHDLLRDRRGGIWVAASNGAVLIEDPAGPAPRFRPYEAPEGLARDSLRALGEDAEGHIYLGSARGLDRLDPETGRIQSFTTSDGLANNNVDVILRDRQGQMWVGTLWGLSRLEVGASRRPRAPSVFLTGVTVAGVPRHGGSVPRLEDLEVAPGSNRLQIDFTGVSLAPGASLRYQTRLLPGAPEWSSPGPGQSVLLAGLPPGGHRFEVRAVAGSGEISTEPATVSFTVLAPFWRRDGFLAVAGLALAGVTWAVRRQRQRRRAAVERLRGRIAADLHDEVGGSLSRIGILTEVARLRLAGEGGEEARNLLTEIGGTSRELSEVMSDIVWSLDPRRDDLPSLVARLRRFASDTLESRGVALDFDVPAAGRDLQVSSAERRELFLLVKEALHNAARHSQASRVAVSFHSGGGRLVVEIRDDGVGLPRALLRPDATQSGGLGLRSMGLRAQLLGGSLTFESAPKAGTTVRLEMPLATKRMSMRWVGRLAGDRPRGRRSTTP